MSSRPVIRDNTPEEEADIQRQIAEDPDLAEIPPTVKALKRGRPAGKTKQQVTVRLDIDVIRALQTPEAKGWQTRLNQAVRDGLKM